MNFASYQFWVGFFAMLIFLVVIKRLLPISRTGIFDRVFLLGSSFLLFGAESVKSLLIFLLITLWIFLGLKLVQQRRRQSRDSRWVIFCFSLGAVLPLFYFKYGEFLFSIAGPEPFTPSILIPVGISFYTFQLIGILVDSEKKPLDSPPSVLSLLNFASFFPQIVAGPIERRDSLLPQLEKFKFRFLLSNLNSGLVYIIVGLFYKLVVADNLAEASHWITDPINSAPLIHLGNLLFGLRIYFDFCGYSLVAVGLGKILGVELTLNFEAPYISRNIREFWRRWHITLSNWFRDYIYIPLGGNQSRFPLALVLLVFLLSGVWHGAGWNFIIWGSLHGVMIGIQSCHNRRFQLTHFASWALTVCSVCFSWLFFYQQDIDILLHKLKILVYPSAYVGDPLKALLSQIGGYGELAHLGVFLALGLFVSVVEWLSVKHSDNPYFWFDRNWVLGVLVLAIVWLAPVSNNGFVYFNF